MSTKHTEFRVFRGSNYMVSIFYLIQTAAQIPANEDWLNEAEREVLAGLRFPKRRRDWLLGRWTAKQAILRFQKAPLSSLEIRAAQDGAPEAYLGGEPAGVSLSISHSRDRSLCAVSPEGLRVGCDLERIEPREENFAADYFTPEEISCTLQSALDQTLAVTLIWSAKESCLKCLRKGLSLDTRSVIITPEFGGNEGLWNSWTGRCADSSSVFYGWWRAVGGFVHTISSDQHTSPPQPL